MGCKNEQCVLEADLFSEPTLDCEFSGTELLTAGLTTPDNYYVRNPEYMVLQNKPAINGHILKAGENGLDEIGLTECSAEDIQSLFL